MEHHAYPCTRRAAGVLQRGLDASLGETVPAQQQRPAYTVYDPTTKQWTIVDTCFGTFHLNFAHDANNTIWSGNGGVVGWVNTKVLDETRDQQKAQGWAPLILDTNGNGKQDAWVEPTLQSIPPRTSGLTRASTRSPSARWTKRFGATPTNSRAPSFESRSDRILRARRSRKSTKCRPDRCQDSTCTSREAWMWTPTASRGRCWRAGTTPASIGASARRR